MQMFSVKLSVSVLDSLFLCIFKLLDEFPHSTVFEALAVSCRRSDGHHVIRVFCREADLRQVTR